MSTAAPGTVLFEGEHAQVTQMARGKCLLLRFTGTCSNELVKWLQVGLKGTKQALAINTRGLEGITAPFVQKILDHAARKHPVALVDPPSSLLEILEQLSALEKIPIFSGESALLENGSIPDSMAQEKMALNEIESRFRINPLWRRIDQEDTWLCALCGLEVDDVKIPNATKPGRAALRRVRRHFLEECMAWRAGRQHPLPASVLDAFLAEVNKRKASEEAERKRRLSSELQTLQTRVESMQEMESSLDEAKRRQLHLLPVEPEPDAVADIAVLYRPLQAVSGDFLDFYSIDDNRFGVSIGDVSGHGVETAIVMGMAKMAFRIRSYGMGTVRDIVANANRDLFTELRRSAFVTGIFALIDRDTRLMTYVRAGHTHPLLRRASGGCEELEGEGLPIGVDKGPRFTAALEEREVRLEPGDVLLLYTDGVIEAGPAAAQFGMERLRKALMSAPDGAPARDMLNGVIDALDEFLGDESLSDDVTLVCLKIK